ncbi:MAG: penicillin-insensitive murein endopeptidase [Mariprofundaceae bacterium]|nr:penicillin-insensitive murein endopeptidase [Mariprofundaceae bacterium]
MNRNSLNRYLTYKVRSGFAVLFFLTGCLALVFLSPQTALAAGFIFRLEIPHEPSFPNNAGTKLRSFGCFSAYDGTPLNCGFSLTVTGLKSPANDIANNGGHVHDANRPLVLNRGKLEYLADQDPARLSVRGTTLGTPPLIYAEVTHKLPEVSGKIETVATVTTPYGWVCAGGCFTRTSWRKIITYDVGIRGLVKLPGPLNTENPATAAGDYIKVRGGTDTHPEGSFGTPFALDALKNIAKKYKKARGRALSINDMSLPKGGLFDYRATWKPDHNTHRRGKDGDINQDGLRCLPDKDLREAIDAVIKPPSKGKTRLHCESGGRKHIDLEPF